MLLLRPFFWDKKNYISYGLLPFSYIYLTLQKLRFYFSKPYKSFIKTICVGNYTIGGSGKTPAVIEIAKYYTKQKKNICIISRGYKGTIEGPVVVDPQFHKYETVGDEPLLLAKFAPTIVSKNKLEAIKFAEKQGFNLAIFDDGLQNPTIDYDLKIVIYDLNHGNELLFPAGPLRELPKKCLNRCDVILAPIELPSSCESYRDKWLKFSVIPTTNSEIKNKDLMLFAGIGNPKKFFDFVLNLGGKVVEKIAFPDHYQYQNIEIEELIKNAQNLNARLLTTEKDYIKIPADLKNYISFLPISYKIENLDPILKKIL